MSSLPTIQEQEEPTATSPSGSANRVKEASRQFSDKFQQSSQKKASGDAKRNGSKQPLATQIDEVTLTEDCFGLYKTENKLPVKIMRYTWRTTKNVEVQIITYGARILSMKFPDRKGVSADVVLGFGDIAGYIYYGEHYFGATIGAVTGKIRDASFEIQGRRIKVIESQNGHYNNGQPYGLDKVVWNSYANGTKVTLSHVIPHKHNGLPGPVMMNITYELTLKNEFRINMEARSGKLTIINLSNLCYFNLGGHNGGPEELKKHSVLMNCNCYTLMESDGLPSGKIMNVSSTRYDFSKPTLLKNYLGAEPGDGYDQNFCINRATSQGSCLVARVTHTTNGRVMEIYSNQYGVRFDTANELGLGVVSPPIKLETSMMSQAGTVFIILNKMFERIREATNLTDEQFEKVHEALVKIRSTPPSMLRFTKEQPSARERVSHLSPDFFLYGFLDALDRSIRVVYDIIPKNIEEIKNWLELRPIINEIMKKWEEMDAIDRLDISENTFEIASEEQVIEAKEQTENLRGSAENSNSLKTSDAGLAKKASSLKNALPPSTKKSSSLGRKGTPLVIVSGYNSPISRSIDSKIDDTKELNQPNDIEKAEHEQSDLLEGPSSALSKEISPKSETGLAENPLNVIPSCYQDGRIHGKNESIYVRHGGMAFQTQNYPDAIHHCNFPSPILRPGEIYRHTIVYKFWVQTKDIKPASETKRCR